MLQSWFGIIRTMDDALCLIEAARIGVIPRITRRLTEKERKALIQPGAVFIFEENESQVRRWADALLWSSSRIKGHFLIYKELDANGMFSTGQEGSPTKGVYEPNSDDEPGLSSSATKSPELPSKAYTLKKKSLSLSTNCGQKLRLISYYREVDVNRLPTIESDPRLTDIYVPDNLYWSSSDMPLASSRTTRRRQDTVNTAGMGASPYVHPQPQLALTSRGHTPVIHSNLSSPNHRNVEHSVFRSDYHHPQAQNTCYPRTYSPPKCIKHSTHNTLGLFTLPEPMMHLNATPVHAMNRSATPSSQFSYRASSPIERQLMPHSAAPIQAMTLTPQIHPLRSVGSMESEDHHSRYTRTTNPVGMMPSPNTIRRPRIRPVYASPYTRPDSPKSIHPPPESAAEYNTCHETKPSPYPSWSRPTEPVIESKTPSPMRSPSLTISPEQHMPNHYPPIFKGGGGGGPHDSARIMRRTSSPPLQTILLPVLNSQVFNNSGFRYGHIEDSADKMFLSALDRTLSCNYERSVP